MHSRQSFSSSSRRSGARAVCADSCATLRHLLALHFYAGPLLSIAVFLIAGGPNRAVAAGVPIDWIELGSIGNYTQDYLPTGDGLLVLGVSNFYHLQGGGGWDYGAGSAHLAYGKKASVELSGTRIDYVLDVPIGSRIFSRIDYDKGVACTYGELVSTDRLVLRAVNGSTTATLAGLAQLTRNEPPENCIDDRYHPLNAPVGWLVPFNVTYSVNAGWTPTRMDNEFDYNLSGTLDFTRAIVPEPASGLQAMVLITAGIGFWRRYKRQLCKSPTTMTAWHDRLHAN